MPRMAAGTRCGHAPGGRARAGREPGVCSRRAICGQPRGVQASARPRLLTTRLRQPSSSPRPCVGGTGAQTDISAFLTVLHNEHTEPLPALRKPASQPCVSAALHPSRVGKNLRCRSCPLVGRGPVRASDSRVLTLSIAYSLSVEPTDDRGAYALVPPRSRLLQLPRTRHGTSGLHSTRTTRRDPPGDIVHHLFFHGHVGNPRIHLYLSATTTFSIERPASVLARNRNFRIARMHIKLSSLHMPSSLVFAAQRALSVTPPPPSARPTR